MDLRDTALHDAVLVSIEVAWDAARVRLLLETCETTPRRLAIHIEGLRLLTCPRREPWGKGGASSVNGVHQEVAGDGGVRLEIEMQSGDQIEIEAGATRLEECWSAAR
jgi:hypothetical protein